MSINPQLLQGDFIQQVRFGMYSWVSMDVLRCHSPNTTTTSATMGPSHVSMARISAASTLKITSDSANDASGGTGAVGVLVVGLNASFEPQTELVTMNGSNGVTTTKTWAGVNNLIVMSAGSVGVNVGNIHAGEGVVTSGVPATDYYVMPASYGLGWTGVYYVPAGKVGLPYSLIATVRSTARTAEIVVATYDYSHGVQRIVAPIGMAGNTDQFALYTPTVLGEGDWFTVNGYVDSTTADITVFVLGLIMDANRYNAGF